MEDLAGHGVHPKRGRRGRQERDPISLHAPIWGAHSRCLMQTVFRCLAGLAGSAMKLGVGAVVVLLWVAGCGGGASSGNNDADQPRRGTDAAGGASQTDAKTDAAKDSVTEAGGGSGGGDAATVDSAGVEPGVDVDTARS